MLIPLLLMFAATACWWGGADIYAAQAQSHIKAWQKAGEPLDEQEWDEVRGILVNSLNKHPDFPPYLELLGELNLTQSLDLVLDDADTRGMRQTALENFHKVVSLRPSWPYGWGDVALVKLVTEEEDIASVDLMDEELDKDLFHVVERAASLGLWESKVQRVVAKAGLSNWEDLDDAGKWIITENIKRGAHRQPDQIIEIARDYEEVEIICPLLKDEQRTKYCSSER